MATEKDQKVYLCLAHMSGNEERFIKEAFDTNWVVPLGPNVDGFEKDLEQFVGNHKKVAALVSGTAALHLSLILAGVEQGDEVLCQSFTFAASANPIVYIGATPVFVDSEPSTWNMSAELLEEAIKDRIVKTGKAPKALVMVHLYGMPCMISEIIEIANRYNIKVIEDAAEAMGSVYKGKPCGTFGHFGVFSFNGNKMITTSGGGAIICSTEEEKKRVTFYATQARENFPYYQHEKIGYNYRMSNICAGIGRGQMTIVNEHIAHHKHTTELYKTLFDNLNDIELHVNPSADFESNYWLNTIVIDKESTQTSSEEVRVVLEKEGIETRPLWKPLHLQPVFASAPSYVNGVSEALFNAGLCLPSGPCVSDNDINRIAKGIEACIKR